MEFDFEELKESFTKKKTNISTEKNEQTCLDQFCSFKRKRRPSIEEENKFNKLPDEMILMILKWLPKKRLVRSMLVCKRWYQIIAQYKALWVKLNLALTVLNEGTLGHILPRGVRYLSLAQMEIVDPVFCEGSEVFSDSYISKLEWLHLSKAIISPVGLSALLSKCKHLKKLKLQKCIVNRDCCRAISQNTELEVLNLTWCENIDVECIMDLMKLKCLTDLEMEGCDLNEKCMTLLCRTLPISIMRLTLTGYRVLTDNNVKDLTKSCPDIIELDLDSCRNLTMRTIHYLENLLKLQYLSMYYCGICPSAYRILAHKPGLFFTTAYLQLIEPFQKILKTQNKYIM